jgi:hypothetical protein
MHLTNRCLDAETLVFGKDECWILGNKLSLIRCRIFIRARGRNFVLNDAEFKDCEIIARVNQIDVDWTSARLENCSFQGQFTGCDFGLRPPPGGDSNYGRLVDCDFTHAWLDCCRFFNCEATAIKLPAWPCFSIIDLERARSEFVKLDLPENLSWYFLDRSEPGECICSYNGKQIAKKCRITEDEVYNLVRDKPYIIY